MAKNFFYVCAGLFLLSLVAHLAMNHFRFTAHVVHEANTSMLMQQVSGSLELRVSKGL